MVACDKNYQPILWGLTKQPLESVLYMGMTSMMLAKQHNEFNSIQHTTGFSELVVCCRKLYFGHFAIDGITDDGKTDLPRERYNSKKYIAYKQECLAVLTTSQIVRSFIFTIAMWLIMLCTFNRVKPLQSRLYRWHCSLLLSIIKCRMFSGDMSQES